jgi:predicted house-cleaning noncanonical NTP pyrophosphatase (MazG superfamily)
MQVEHHKLVRDRIPEIIERSGARYEIEILSEEEYRDALGAKLLEEARETVNALQENPEAPIEELADLREVIDAIARLAGIEPAEIDRVQERKRLGSGSEALPEAIALALPDRGGFEKRIRLVRTENFSR